MNWLDIVITVTWISGLFLGWRMGLFGAVFAAGGAVVGVFLAARFSDNIADLLTDSVSSDTLATVIAYGIILIAVFAAAQIIRSIVKESLKRVALGWVDPVGGMVLGLVAGFLLSGAIVTVMARYSTDIPSGLSDNEATMFLIDRSGLQEQLRDSLVDSNMVPIYLDARDSIPGFALVLVPAEFKFALNVLELEIRMAENDEK